MYIFQPVLLFLTENETNITNALVIKKYIVEKNTIGPSGIMLFLQLLASFLHGHSHM